MSQDPDMTAAEYVLGVLDAPERAAAAARIATEPPFAEEVAAWEGRLAPLSAETAPVAPPAVVWRRIAVAVGARPGWNRLSFWTGAAVAGLAACLAAAVWPLLSPPAPPPAAPALLPTEFARLSPDETKPASVIATLDPNRHELILTPVSLHIAADKSAELWVIPEGREAISLGVMDATTPTRIALPEALIGPGKTTAKLAITVEQPGGSPTGKAQGPVIAIGGFGAA